MDCVRFAAGGEAKRRLQDVQPPPANQHTSFSEETLDQEPPNQSTGKGKKGKCFKRGKFREHDLSFRTGCATSERLTQQESRDGDRQANHPEGDTGQPKCPFLCQQGQRTNNQSNFQDYLSGVETIRPLACHFPFLFEVAGLLADLVLVLFVAFRLLDVLLAKSGRLFFVGRGQRSEHIRNTFHFVQANILGLEIGPLVRGLRLQQNFLAGSAVPKQRSDRDKHSQDRESHSDRDHERVVAMAPVFFRCFHYLVHFGV